jgi:hypothetical protein
MKIGGPQPAAGAALPIAPARRVEAQRTPVTRADLRNSIRRALTESSGGDKPSEQMVDVLTAHASLETASGDKMYNFNFAGIKGRSPEGTTAICHTKEVVGGQEVTIKDGFRAYSSLDAGARDYVGTMKGQFSGALAPAARGDVAGFASALKNAHYYTASEVDYARGLSSLMNAPAGGAARPGTVAAPSISHAFAATDLGLSTASLSRVEGTLDASRWMGGLEPASLSSSLSSASSSSSSASSRVHSASDDEDDS